MISPTPEVDILMATYNGEKYLSEQIESILRQTYVDFRLIIADDCSTDSTRDILVKYSSLDKRIQLIFNESNLGVVKNFEKLISYSTAKFFMLSDQDDVWDSKKVEISLSKIMSTNCLLVYSDLKLIDMNNKQTHSSFWSYSGIKPINEKEWKNLLSQNVVTGCTVIARDDLKRFALPFPKQAFIHDWWLALAAAVNGEISYIDNALVNYRQHQSNEIGALSSTYNFKKTINNCSSYADFLCYREDNILVRHSYAQACLIWSNNSQQKNEIFKEITQYKKMLDKILTIKYFDITFNALKLKRKFKSQGLYRNVWWVMVMGYPIIAYLLIKLSKNAVLRIMK